ncbi:MAG: transposase, partial [Rhodoplanes sp.]
ARPRLDHPAHDIKGFTALLRMIGDKIDALLGDKGRDADAVREALKEIEVDVEAIIPSKSNRKQPIEFDRQAYKQRNLMEPGFNKLKNWPRIATRYDKSAAAAISSRSASVGLGGDKPAHDEDAGQLFRPHSERCVRVGGFRWVSMGFASGSTHPTHFLRTFILPRLTGEDDRSSRLRADERTHRSDYRHLR